MSVTVRVPTTLRTLTGGASEVAVEGATVGDVLAALEALLAQVRRAHPRRRRQPAPLRERVRGRRRRPLPRGARHPGARRRDRLDHPRRRRGLRAGPSGPESLGRTAHRAQPAGRARRSVEDERTRLCWSWTMIRTSAPCWASPSGMSSTCGSPATGPRPSTSVTSCAAGPSAPTPTSQTHRPRADRRQAPGPPRSYRRRLIPLQAGGSETQFQRPVHWRTAHRLLVTRLGDEPQNLGCAVAWGARSATQERSPRVLMRR